jgi:hypothetical protein
MTQANILELCRQGNVQAIASLMSSQLQFKNVTVKVILNNDCLEVIFKSAQAPERENLVKYVRQEIIGLKITCIKKVKVYGFWEGNSSPLWSQEFNLELPSK